MTDKAIKEPRTRTPEEKVLIGIIQQAMEDSFDLRSTTHDHIKKLYNILSDKYKRGLVTRDELRFAIRRLELKL
jgi:hypothetical protein